ncbi:MAG TPA: bifunctional 4-hydroxy-2-oxoglutarate aldolase/2-dehydro-3-deoxy-phosphogluconate aldolase [Bryobacteraceae bacterium]|nr:bifunctional 4-hydroxy-2-oxoglutarate aldolase/2-dehydro-3-deoxy-phosphogluconate aldolase [Bryobacteraceae bacterium]
MTKQEVKSIIERTGIIPAVRARSADDALFAAETVIAAGIPIVEVTMTTPGALDVIRTLARRPGVVAGAGTVVKIDTARQCLDAGAHFLSSPGLAVRLVEFALKENTLVFPGALTPTEVMLASEAGADWVKVFPCSLLGGASYVQALKGPFPDVPLVAAGGVGQQTIGEFIRAGAVAVGVGRELIPPQAVHRRQASWISELTRRFIELVAEARSLTF